MSGKAVVSIPLALLSFYAVFCSVDVEVHGRQRLLGLTVAGTSGVLSLVFAVVAIKDVRRGGGTLLGGGAASIGIGIMILTALELAFLAMVERARTYAPRTSSMNNLSQLAHALLAYEKSHRELPPHAVYSSTGEPLLSWRVLVLPQLDREDLYRQFKLDEAWDSPHNLRLLDKMPPEFAAPYVSDSHVTYYQVFVGRGAAFEGSKGLKLADFTDSVGQTLLVVEANVAVPWTKPQDLMYAPDRHLPKVGGQFPRHFHAAFSNGRLDAIPIDVSEATLRALITRNAGDKPGTDWQPADDH